jgi:hypothetical protein
MLIVLGNCVDRLGRSKRVAIVHLETRAGYVVALKVNRDELRAAASLHDVQSTISAKHTVLHRIQAKSLGMLLPPYLIPLTARSAS